jgi:DNA-binding PadR family transcriptional regulator
VLRTLEKSGDIAAVRSRKVKTYMITGKGLQRVLLFRDSFVDLEDTFYEALGEEYWAAVNEVSKCGKRI